MNKVGYIYILTNKSFKDNCIKIGYSVDVERTHFLEIKIHGINFIHQLILLNQYQ